MCGRGLLRGAECIFYMRLVLSGLLSGPTGLVGQHNPNQRHMQNQRRWDLRAVTVPAVDKPCFSLFSRHSSAFFLFFFLFNNPGCIFSLNQTICLLAFISSNKDSEDPEPIGSRHFLWRLQEALRKKLRALERGLEVTRPAGSISAGSCLFKAAFPWRGTVELWLPFHGSLFCGYITGLWGHLPASSCLLDKELVWRSWEMR